MITAKEIRKIDEQQKEINRRKDYDKLMADTDIWINRIAQGRHKSDCVLIQGSNSDKVNKEYVKEMRRLGYKVKLRDRGKVYYYYVYVVSWPKPITDTFKELINNFKKLFNKNT